MSSRRSLYVSTVTDGERLRCRLSDMDVSVSARSLWTRDWMKTSWKQSVNQTVFSWLRYEYECQLKAARLLCACREAEIKEFPHSKMIWSRLSTDPDKRADGSIWLNRSPRRQRAECTLVCEVLSASASWCQTRTRRITGARKHPGCRVDDHDNEDGSRWQQPSGGRMFKQSRRQHNHISSCGVQQQHSERNSFDTLV